MVRRKAIVDALENPPKEDSFHLFVVIPSAVNGPTSIHRQAGPGDETILNQTESRLSHVIRGALPVHQGASHRCLILGFRQGLRERHRPG